jgi:uncharacterized protein (DUF2336 family)
LVAYRDFFSLSQSADSEERGCAAHMAASAYLTHDGPADEQAALYAALIGFLEDPSIRVRAALAHGLLHAKTAPRAVLLALLQDGPVIARAVAQYSPALIDADLISLLKTADSTVVVSVAMRETLTTKLAHAVLARGVADATLKILSRADVLINADVLVRLAHEKGDEAALRGALLARKDLPPDARLVLVDCVVRALRETRIVAGALAPQRLERLLRGQADYALTAIGEAEAGRAEPGYAQAMISDDRISTRVMLHAIINGHVLFFADCLAELSEVSRPKVFTLLETGSRAALGALLCRCGVSEAVRNLIIRLVLFARDADLADDVAARHFVVTAVTDELITEFDGKIPDELEEAFNYLSEQNVTLARNAARGVVSAFSANVGSRRALPASAGEFIALPAA